MATSKGAVSLLLQFIFPALVYSSIAAAVTYSLPEPVQIAVVLPAVFTFFGTRITPNCPS
jgi:hypothetical protein